MGDQYLLFQIQVTSTMAVGGALFGPTAARNQSKSLVEFRAGKMNLNLSTKMVSPDKRKGLLSVLQSDDQLMHPQWKDRTSGTIEDDLIIFPDDVEFKAVPACTTGRVFVLKFKTSNKRMFFWMQEPKSDKDEEFCKKVNDNLNNPPAPGSTRSGSGLAGGLPAGLDFNNLGDSELQNLLNNMSQQQLMQLFGGSLGGGNMSGLASLLGGPDRQQELGATDLLHQEMEVAVPLPLLQLHQALFQSLLLLLGELVNRPILSSCQTCSPYCQTFRSLLEEML